MIARRRQQRGIALIVVVIIMTIVTVLLAALAFNVAWMYRQRRGEQVRLTARSALASAAELASTRPPGSEPVKLDIQPMLPREMSGSATLTPTILNGKPAWHVSVQVESGPHQAGDELDVAVSPPSATQPQPG